MVVLQLVIPRAIPLPEPGVVRPFTIGRNWPAMAAADPVILARPIFALGAGGNSPSGSQGPVDGATAIGVMSQKGARIAFVQGADGKLVSLRSGDLYRGWRLHAIGRDALTFRRGDESARLPVTVQGADRVAPAPPGRASIPSGSPLEQPHG